MVGNSFTSNNFFRYSSPHRAFAFYDPEDDDSYALFAGSWSVLDGDRFRHAVVKSYTSLYTSAPEISATCVSRSSVSSASESDI